MRNIQSVADKSMFRAIYVNALVEITQSRRGRMVEVVGKVIFSLIVQILWSKLFAWVDILCSYRVFHHKVFL